MPSHPVAGTYGLVQCEALKLLNEEAVEICRLSIWIKTPKRGKVLADLNENIRVGNSVVLEPAVDPRALDWAAAFPQVHAEGGFDLVKSGTAYTGPGGPPCAPFGGDLLAGFRGAQRGRVEGESARVGSVRPVPGEPTRRRRTSR
jgi:Eco57I restriction-modification methylase